MPSLRQLEYLKALATYEHFGRAADACHVSQPTLSTQLRQLEGELGINLIERGPRGMSMTPAGSDIAQRAGAINTGVLDLIDAARQHSETLSGPLSIGCIPTVAPYLLPRILPALREQYPRCGIKIRECFTDVIVPELIAGELDVLLLALPLDNPELIEQHLFDDRFLFVAPADRLNIDDVKATPYLLSRDALLLLEDGHCLRDQALEVCSNRGKSNVDTFGASTLQTLVRLVENGMGSTLLPECSIALETAGARVRTLRFDDPEPTRSIGLAWRRSSPRVDDFAAFGRLVVEATQSRS